MQWKIVLYLEQGGPKTLWVHAYPPSRAPQVGCSRRKAVKALKESDGDLINAIMNAS